MSALKEPTIDGLIDKLLEENYIDKKEEETVQGLLSQAASGMTKDEIFMLVTTLNNELEATSSALITPNGLNYTSFDTVVKKVSDVIKKDKIEKENEEAKKAEFSQEKTVVDKTQEEKAEIERQERIAQNRKDIDDIMKEIAALKDIELSDDCKTRIAEEMEKKRQVDKEYKRLIEEGQSPEEALNNAYEKVGISRSENNPISDATNVMTVIRDIKKIDPSTQDNQVNEYLKGSRAYQEFIKIPGVEECLEQERIKGNGLIEAISNGLNGLNGLGVTSPQPQRLFSSTGLHRAFSRCTEVCGRETCCHPFYLF